MKINKENREKLKEIIDILFDIENLGGDAVVRYFGFAQSLDLDVYFNGWERSVKADYRNNCYIDSGKGDYFGENIDDCIKSLKEIRKELRNTKRKEEV